MKRPNKHLTIGAIAAGIALFAGSAIVSGAGEGAGTMLVPTVPVRVLDTRLAGSPILRLGANGDATVSFADAVPAGTRAVDINITTTGGTNPSYLAVYPTGTERPITSAVNWNGPTSQANAIAVKLGDNYEIDIYNAFGTVDVVIDLMGYYLDAPSGSGSSSIQAGSAGAAGATGATGPAGADGTTGPRGIPGPAGAKGDTGATGATGQDGIDGTNGVDGADGAAGPAGSAGPAGTDGAAGPAGSAGPAGTDGAAGADGLIGADGTNGTDGADGLIGADGANGADGFNGAAGADGLDGAAGLEGAAGAAGLEGAAGADGLEGAAGADGLNGLDGADGADGPAGPQGAIGPAGVAGPVGPTGPVGPAAVSGYEVVSAVATNNGSTMTQTATCPTGKKVLGGGANTTNNNLHIVGSAPSGTLNQTAWTATADRIAQVGGSQYTLTVYAICANV